MTDILELKNVDSLDIDDVLRKIEKSFQIQFGDKDFKDAKTFGELCDIIVGKIQLDNTEDCTTQQAFYRLRIAICQTQSIHLEAINTNTDLKTIFPRRVRIQKIKQVEVYLGFALKALRPKHWVMLTFVLIFLASLVELFIKWQFGLIGILFFMVGVNIAKKFGEELDLNTVGELAEKMASENYFKSRRNATTVNRKEIVDKIRNLFINDLALRASVLTRESTFI